MEAVSTQPDTRTGGPAGIPWKDLASNIINRHMTEDDVLDNISMAKLKGFVSDPESHAAAVRSGKVQPKEGCLIDYIVERHGTADQKMLDGELEELREWFRNGGGQVNPKYPTSDKE